LIALAAALLVRAPTYATELPGQLYLHELYFPLRYRVDPFIRLAVALQSLGRSAALDKLHAMARDPEAAARVIVVARMLFVPRPGTDLRRAMIGGAIFLGGTDYSDWPQEPIEVVDGVPFLITKGYSLIGLPETSEAYLEYCETNGDWSAFRYSVKTTQQKRDALKKLFASDKWKATLNDTERKFLANQIE
jgi:hypothetical protein